MVVVPHLGWLDRIVNVSFPATELVAAIIYTYNDKFGTATPKMTISLPAINVDGLQGGLILNDPTLLPIEKHPAGEAAITELITSGMVTSYDMWRYASKDFPVAPAGQPGFVGMSVFNITRLAKEIGSIDFTLVTDHAGGALGLADVFVQTYRKVTRIGLSTTVEEVQVTGTQVSTAQIEVGTDEVHVGSINTDTLAVTLV